MAAEVVTMTCAATGDRARVLVSQGFNCFEYVANVRGEKVDVLWSLPNFESGEQRPSSSGIPLLFPFPGRIPGASFTWEGKEYALEPSDKFGNAIHGFCHSRPWRVVAKQDDSVTAEFHASRVDPTIARRWPSDFKVTASYELGAGVLAGVYKFENVGDEPLPCGFGTHPYFRVPLSKSSAASTCQVRFPAAKQWELVDMLPTGKATAFANDDHYTTGAAFGAMKYDDVFSLPMGATSATIQDPKGITLTVSWDSAFRELVVFTPPHREAICIEPYTCVPAAIALRERGIDSGLRILSPGESFTARMEVRIS